jgi:hypothetical protein
MKKKHICNNVEKYVNKMLISKKNGYKKNEYTEPCDTLWKTY